ncbi:hypothetical protein AALO_G00115000 [Alosa alosa]|uniref:Uncharacterized protein n=1 Tax=Alosa alosa TaxID=278164 RepID=A0AAV6GR85_9TELE|nr:hypothetical protein AALO_G00115000 [Alosa alosa]
MSAKNRSGQETCAVENMANQLEHPQGSCEGSPQAFVLQDGWKELFDQPPQRAEVAFFWRHPRLVVLLKLVEATMKRQQKEKAGGKGCCY